MNEEEQIKILAEFVDKLISGQTECPPEIEQALNEDFWDLI